MLARTKQVGKDLYQAYQNWQSDDGSHMAASVSFYNEVRSGEGRLVRYRGKQWAVYRDDQGTLHVLSPVCTHAGCHVQWNEFQKTWDCPYHGGRFAPSGERIYGPPPADLEFKAVDDL
jgi:Rieske Fe-S protein